MNAPHLTADRLLDCPSDLQRLRELLCGIHDHPRKHEIVAQGQPLQHTMVLVEGWAMRLRLLADGRCQVISLLLPLDLLAAPPLPGAVADHSVVALTDCRVAACAAADLIDLCKESAVLHAVFAWLADHDAAVLKEHIVALGQRDARERVAWLFYEIWQRLRILGRDGNPMHVPLSRTVVADALGLSERHLGRVLQELADDGVLEFARHRFRVLDRQRLEATAEADPVRFGDDVRKLKARLRQALGG